MGDTSSYGTDTANLVLGSDRLWDTSHDEAAHLAGLGVLDNSTLLRMWTENCARTVFPNRRVGRLDDGFEGSFLVLSSDPVEDLAAVQHITLRVKDGQFLRLEDGRSAN